MTIEEFFSWLAVADLAKRDRYETREMLSKFVEDLPDNRMYDQLAEVLESHVRNPTFIPDHLADLHQRFQHLLPQAQSPLEVVEDSLDDIAEELEPESYQTDRLVQFEQILKGLDSQPTEAAEGKLRRQLAELEAQFRAVWDDYLKINVAPSEVTAESVAGHRFLEDAFSMWFQAFEQATELDLDQAWESANEGNRLLLAVSTWSDQIRSENVAEIAQG